MQKVRQDGEPDLLVMDLRLPGMDGLTAIGLLRANCPGLAVVVVSADENPERPSQALRAGASAWISKSAPAAQMAAVLGLALAGELPDRDGARATAAGPQALGMQDDATGFLDTEATDVADTAGLTLRQLEVLALMSHGYSNKHIARELELTEKTVKAHLTRVFRFLGVVNRTQALLAAQRQTLLPQKSD